MVSFFKTVDGRLERIQEKENGCWINVINPSDEEIEFLCSEIGTDRGFIRSALDEEEASRVENEEDQTLIIIDVPIAQKAESSTLTYYTLPMGIILSENYIITLSSRENSIIKEFSEGLVKNVKTELKTQFLLLILLRVAGRFLQYLKQIDKLSNYVEKQLHKSQKNKELIQLLDLEKSMVFFSTSLKSDKIEEYMLDISIACLTSMMTSSSKS
jgi:magnesium transporter